MENGSLSAMVVVLRKKNYSFYCKLWPYNVQKQGDRRRRVTVPHAPRHQAMSTAHLYIFISLAVSFIILFLLNYVF